MKDTDPIIEKTGGEAFRNAFRNHGAVMYVVDLATFAIVDANEAALKFYGYDMETMLTKRIPDINITPEPLIRAEIKKAVEEGRSYYIFKHRLANGDVRDVEIYANPIHIGGRDYSFSIVHDITTRYEAEKKLKESERLLAETQKIAQLGSWEFDAKTEQIKWSDETFRIAGRKPKDKLKLKEYLGTVHPDDLPLLKAELDKSAAEKKPYEIEIRHKKPDGSYNQTLTRGKPIFEDGKITKFIGSVLDITERRKAEEDKKKLETRLQQARRMEAIGTLAGGIAHQFNNALSGIMGNVELIELGIDGSQNRSKYTENIKILSDRMAKLAQQLLAYARGGKYQETKIFGNDLVRDTLPLLKHTVNPNIDIDTDISSNVCLLKVDITQMQMVFSAILSNASEAIEGKGRIRVICNNVKISARKAMDIEGLKKGDYVCIKIEDDGSGMDEETMNRIFEPFFTTKLTGRGLGMAAAYGIIKNHGGSITIDSKIDKGTIVSIYLPAIKEKIIPTDLSSTSTSVSEANGTILVIEDEKMVKEMICSQIERLGYRFLSTETGKDAINLIKTFDGDIDLVILDMILGDMSGKEIYLQIKKIRPKLKVIVCSGYSIDGPAKEVLALGADDFIQKPFRIAELAEKLQQNLTKES